MMTRVSPWLIWGWGMSKMDMAKRFRSPWSKYTTNKKPHSASLPTPSGMGWRLLFPVGKFRYSDLAIQGGSNYSWVDVAGSQLQWLPFGYGDSNMWGSVLAKVNRYVKLCWFLTNPYVTKSKPVISLVWMMTTIHTRTCTSVIARGTVDCDSQWW